MPKPPPRRVYADEYSVTIDDVEYHSHEGEWVEFVGKPSVQEQADFRALIAHTKESQAIVDRMDAEPKLRDEVVRRDEEYDRMFYQLCDRVGHACVAWNLTDARSQPYPEPDGTGAPVRALERTEVYWLWQAYRGDFDPISKNALSGSGPISINATKKARNR